MTSKYAIALAQKQIGELSNTLSFINTASIYWTEFVIDLFVMLDELKSKLNEVENNHKDMV